MDRLVEIMGIDADNGLLLTPDTPLPQGFQQILGLNKQAIDPVGMGVTPDVNGWSFKGFAGRDENLNLLYSRDHADLEWAGVTPQQIAQRLRQLMQTAANTDQDVFVDNLKVVRTAIYSKVGQECPCGCAGVSVDGMHSETHRDYEITDTVTSRSIAVSELLPHLIENHQFFEGKGTEFRLYPLEAVSILGLGTRTSEEIDNRLLTSFMEDLNNSEFGVARAHVLSRLSWFSARSDFSSLSNGIIDKLFADSDHAGLRLAVSSLIKVGNENVSTILLTIKSKIESQGNISSNHHTSEMLKELQVYEREKKPRHTISSSKRSVLSRLSSECARYQTRRN